MWARVEMPLLTEMEFGSIPPERDLQLSAFNFHASASVAPRRNPEEKQANHGSQLKAIEYHDIKSARPGALTSHVMVFSTFRPGYGSTQVGETFARGELSPICQRVPRSQRQGSNR